MIKPKNTPLFPGRAASEGAARQAFEAALSGERASTSPNPTLVETELPQLNARLRRLVQLEVPAVPPVLPASSPRKSSFRPLLIAGGAAAALMSSTAVCAGMVTSASVVAYQMTEKDPYPQVRVPHFSSSEPVAIASKEEEESEAATEAPEVPADLASKIRKRLEELDAKDGDTPLPQMLLPDGRVDKRDLYIGTSPVKIAPYSKVADIASAQEYFDFLTNTAASPTDFAELIHPNILPFNPARLDLASTPEETLERGNGDCDDYSEMVRRGLLTLGKREGKNYKPRVIAQHQKGVQVGHAIAIYQDGGQWYAVDQSEPVAFTNIDEASTLFVPTAQADRWADVITMDPGRSFQMPLNEDLIPDYEAEFVGILNEEAYVDGFNFTAFPEGWEKYRSSLLCFDPVGVMDCNEVVTLEYGNIAEVAYKQGDIVMERYSRGQLTERVYRSGPYILVKYERGKPVEGVTFSGKEVRL